MGNGRKKPALQQLLQQLGIPPVVRIEYDQGDVLQETERERQRQHERADQMAAENERLRKPTWKEVYERYRRRHAKDSSVTIEKVCEEMGVNYANIRAAKSRATKRKKPSQKRHK